MTTATETQPTRTAYCVAAHDELPCEACGYRPAQSQPTISLSNFRVEYYAPKYEDGKVLYDGYCAILADDASLDGATVRVFNVPDADEGQRAVAEFACEAMNRHEQHVRLLEAAKLLLAMNNCNYDRDQMRRSGGFDALLKVVEQIQPDWHHRVKTTQR